MPTEQTLVSFWTIFYFLCDFSLSIEQFYVALEVCRCLRRNRVPTTNLGASQSDFLVAAVTNHLLVIDFIIQTGASSHSRH